MASKKPKKSRIKTRDYNMVNIIKGATKAGVHIDRKKEANKNASREEIDPEEIYVLCRQCHFPIREMIGVGMFDPKNDFCSETCFDFYNEQHGE